MSKPITFVNNPNIAQQIASSDFVHNDKQTEGSLWLRATQWMLKRANPEKTNGFSDTHTSSCNSAIKTIFIRPGISRFSTIGAIARQAVEAQHNSRELFSRLMPRVNRGEISCQHVGLLVTGNIMMNDFFRFPTLYNKAAHQLDATPNKFWGYSQRISATMPNIPNLFKSIVSQCSCQKNPAVQMNRMTHEERQAHFELHQFNNNNW